MSFDVRKGGTGPVGVMVRQVTVDIGALPNGAGTTVSIPVVEAQVGDGCQVNPTAALSQFLWFVHYHVNSPGNVDLVIFNGDVAPITPGPTTLTITLNKP